MSKKFPVNAPCPCGSGKKYKKCHGSARTAEKTPLLRAPETFGEDCVAYTDESGNSGSHLLGILLLLDPIGRVALLLPVLDLLRVSLVRLAAGARPWVGDRRHLAHRLQKTGLSAPLVALILIAIAAPSFLGTSGARSRVIESSLGLGALVTILLFGAAIRLTPKVE